MISLPVEIGDIIEPDVVVSHIDLGLVGQLSYFLGHLRNLLIRSEVMGTRECATLELTSCISFSKCAVYHPFTTSSVWRRCSVNFVSTFASTFVHEEIFSSVVRDSAFRLLRYASAPFRNFSAFSTSSSMAECISLFALSSCAAAFRKATRALRRAF